jgi:predicted outer membrane repeat protein
MKSKLHFLQTLAVSTLMLMSVASMNAAVWYVKPNASGTGASWDDPCNISVIAGTPAGIADGDIVYMAAGTYESSTSKSITKYISVFGGYPSNLTGTELPTRNLSADSTIFTPSSGGTARCLVLNATTAPGINKIVLDGLNFKGFTMATGNGGTAISITSSQSNIDIKNCDFISNISLNANGGAIYMGSFAYNITISFDNCNFRGNQATYSSALGYGGAAYFNNGTTVAKTINFTNCTFKNNTAYNRGGALYFTTYITSNISDCFFDTNYCTNSTDNTSSGGCMYIAGGTQSNTFNVTRSIFLNSSCTAKGSVFWFNTTPKNYLNLTNCSLIGNYAKRASSARAAIDADNFTTNFQFTLNGCVLSNYNYGGSPAAKQSNKADVMLLSNTPTVLNSTASTFTNSILNGVYFATGNTLDATSPSVLYATSGYLADSTISLALSGDLKITNKIIYKKTFTSAMVGTFTHAQIYDVKAKLNIPMTLMATIPSGYILKVDGTDYTTGSNVEISIPASASDPVIALRVDTSTGINNNGDSNVRILTQGGALTLTGISAGNVVSLYNAAGQLISRKQADSDMMTLQTNGLVIVKINDGMNTRIVKTLVH